MSKLNTVSESIINESEDSYDDYPQAATDNARRALAYKDKEGNPKKCGTEVGWARAHQLANREKISKKTIQRIANFNRHGQNKDNPYDKGCGKLMWDAWGGTEGIEWAIKKIKQIKEQK